MPAIEHYAWSGWYLAVVPGAYAIGMLVLMAWMVRGLHNLPRRSGRVAVGAEPAEVV